MSTTCRRQGLSRCGHTVLCYNMVCPGDITCCVHERHCPLSANRKATQIGWLFLLAVLGSRLKSLQVVGEFGL